MARAPKIRVSYRQDASYLLRLSEAISMDDKLIPAYRTELVTLVEKAARKLMDARLHTISSMVTDDETKE